MFGNTQATVVALSLSIMPTRATPPGRAPIHLPRSRTTNLTKSQDLQPFKKHDVPVFCTVQGPRRGLTEKASCMSPFKVFLEAASHRTIWDAPRERDKKKKRIVV